MEFSESVKSLANRLVKLIDSVQTEEATKNAMIMPMLQLLGYDVFNPTEVIPEFTADIGLKKGEKVDYCIVIDEHPEILIECKCCKDANLDVHKTQLHRYYAVTDSAFGILTNGVEYRFYTDIDKANVMDDRPFLTINLASITDAQIVELHKFHKQNFDHENIVQTANTLRLISDFRAIVKSEIENPTPEFIKYCLKRIDPQTVVTSKTIEYSTPIAKRAFGQFINDIVTSKLMNALEQSPVENSPEQPKLENTEEENKINTTEEEIEGYYAVKSILNGIVDLSRVKIKDTQSYCAINLDKTTQPIVRLWLNGGKKYIGTFDFDKKETKHPMESVNDIYALSELIKDCVGYYIQEDL